MEQSFAEFLVMYLDVWRSSSLSKLKNFISTEYKGSEITNGEVVDFGYEESINGWEMGFNFVKESKAQWKLNIMAIVPLRQDETMVIISAALDIQGESSKTANLFFQTFRKHHMNDWKLVRSYIEADLPIENLQGFNSYGYGVGLSY